MANRYVAPGGSNANPGTFGSPYQRLSYALAQCSAGDTLFIREGTYTHAQDVFDSQVYTVPSGSSGNPISIVAYPGEVITIKPPSGWNGIRLTTGVSYLHFYGFIIDQSNDVSGVDGIYLSGGTHHCTFEFLEVANARGFGIQVTSGSGQCHHTQILDTWSHDHGDDSGDPLNGHGMYIWAPDCVIDGCLVYNNQGHGIDCYDNSGNLNTSRIQVSNNTCWYMGRPDYDGYGHAIVLADGEDHLVFNNVLFENDGGVLMYTNARGSLVFNNTIYENLDYGITAQYLGATCYAWNNIVYSNGSGGAQNIVPQPGEPLDEQTNLEADPGFVDAGSGDFHILSASAARGAGTDLSAYFTTDFDGVTRTAWDIGAFEYVAPGASVNGELVVTLGGLGLSTSGTVAIVATTTKTLSSLTVASTATVVGPVTATVSKTLGALTLTATSEDVSIWPVIETAIVTHSLEMALGGRIRDVLIHEPSAVSAWPLSELQFDTAKDIVFGYNPGAYSGTIERGIPLEFPTGELGARFNGFSHVEVPNDGDGYERPDEAGSRNLSLAGGDMSIIAVIQVDSYAGRVMAKGPALFLRMANASDTSGNGRHGTAAGGVMFGVGGALSDGSGAAQFDGTNDVVTVAHVSALSFDVGSEFTIEAWFNTTSTAEGVIIGKSSGLLTTAEYELGVGDSGTPFVRRRSSAGSQVILNGDQSGRNNGAWHYMVVRLQAGVLSLWMEGIEVDSDPDVTGTCATTNDVQIGHRLTSGTPSDLWAGYLDEIVVTPSALTDEEIVARHAARVLTFNPFDGVRRCIVQKQAGGGSAGIGWHVALANNNVYFYARNAAGVLWNFGRGHVADGQIHLIRAFADYSAGLVGIEIDGYLSGGYDSGHPAELPVTSAPLRIGRFADDSGGFIGVIGLVSVGRDASVNVGYTLQATRVWEDVTDQTRAEVLPLQAKYGGSSQPGQPMGGAGTLTFALNNLSSQAGDLQARWTPDHANAVGGWNEGVPVRWRVTVNGETRTKFFGSVQTIEPSAGRYGRQTVTVMASTWLRQASIDVLGSVAVQLNKRSDEVFGRVVDQATLPPPAIAFSEGNATFPFALDSDAKSKLISVMAAVAHSEGGYAYERGDGTLVFESSSDRENHTVFDDVFTETELQGLTVVRDKADRANKGNATITPRDVADTATVQLAAMTGRVLVEAGQETEVVVSYRDPEEKAQRISAVDIVTPVAGTHFSMTADEEGVGANLNAACEVRLTTSEDLGGSRATLLVKNTGGTDGWFMLNQLLGRALYTYDSVTLPWADETSVRRWGATEPIELNFRYLSDSEHARMLLQREVLLRSEPHQAIRRVEAKAVNLEMAERILQREPGDLVGISEYMTGVESTERHFIAEVTITQEFGQPLRAEWTVVRALPV